MPAIVTQPPFHPSPRTIPPQDSDLRAKLRRQLLALPYRAFLQVILHLLIRQGYSAARPAGRALWKGRNQGGGWDAEAEFSAGAVGTGLCLVQVKQYDTLTVQQRQVDELRGSCLRAGAQQAVLVTLSTLSPVAQQAAEAASSALPLRLLDGETLLTLLMEKGPGIRSNNDGQRQIDERYFDILRDRFDKGVQAQGSQQQERKNKPASLPAPSVTVIVRLAGQEDEEHQFHRL